MPTETPISSARRNYQKSFTTAFGTPGPTGRSGRYVMRGGKLVPIQQADRLKLRKADSVNIVSEATGIHPKQIPEFQKFFHEKGIDGVSFNTKTGECIYRDRQTKLKALAARGFHDKDEVSGGRNR